MTPQTFVKEKFPNAKDMYRDEAGHAIRYYDEKSGKDITLSYGSTSAKAWANAKKNILGNKEGTPIKQEQPPKGYQFSGEEEELKDWAKNEKRIAELESQEQQPIESEDELWNEVGAIFNSSVSFNGYRHFLDKLEKQFTIKRK